MVIFRENTEDIYAGIEFAGGTPDAQKILDFLAKEFPKDFKKIRFGTKEAMAEYMKLAAPDHDASHMPIQVGIGIKPVSNIGTIRLVKSAIEYALQVQAPQRDDCPQRQHHEVHRRRVPRLGLRRRRTDFRRQGLYLGAMGADQEGKRRSRRQRRTKSRAEGRPPAHQRRHRRHHAPASADSPGRIST